MPLHRVLIPLAAAIVVAGLLVAAFVTTRTHPHDPQPVNVRDLIALKNEAEALAIAKRYEEAHAKYRELFARAGPTVEIKDSVIRNLMTQAQDDQDRLYWMILNPRPATTAPAASAPTTTTPQSFVDTHPPYAGAATATTTRAAAIPTTAQATSRAAVATTTTAPATVPAVADLPQPAHLKIARVPRDPANFSDAMVGQSLSRASEFLMTQFKDGQIAQGKEYSETFRQGLNALCVYSLLHAGQATRDPRLAVTGEFMRKAIDQMKLHPMAADATKGQQPVVYARSLRAAVLAAANRPEDRDVLKDDVKWLIDAAVDGAYTYDDRFTIRVVPGDPRGVGRNIKKPDPAPPADPNAPKPKTLGTPKGEETPRKPAGPQGIRTAPESTPQHTSNGQCRFTDPDFFTAFTDPDNPIILADGIHDRFGREIWPGPRVFPPPTQPPIYPPQELPDKYVGPFVWDNSNSQFGVLGVAAGADVGIEVPDAYWAAVEKHWMSSQLPDGQWPYRKEMTAGRLSMTCAGVATLLATHDSLEAPSVARTGRQPSPAARSMAAALAWLERGDNATNVGGPGTVYLGYSLHALSRVGLAGGQKYVGTHDLYRELARKVVLSQWDTGAWGRTDQPSADTLIDTAFSALFLARGRHPILMNKLRLDAPAPGAVTRGEWNNRPRDLANLCRFTARELERPVNWQTVSLDRDPADWADAPILYFASHAAVTLSDADVAKLRAFADAGGLLFTQADGGSDGFNLFVNGLAKRLFPEFELKDLSPDDPLYTLQYSIAKPSRPRLRGVSNGSRLLWVHSPTDLAVAWQQRAERTQRPAFEMGVNLFVYASGKTALRNRLDDRAVPEPKFAPVATIGVARLRYGGNWDPEPAAWPRFARHFQWETSVGLAVRAVDLSAAQPGLDPATYPLAHLTGGAAFTPTAPQLTAIRDYVAAGGTLVIEAVGGADAPFADSLQSAILPKAFPATRFEPMPPTHPMLRATFRGTEDVWPPRLRPYATQKLGQAMPPIRTATVGKGRVIYLPLDATSGLLGTNTWPIFGYEASEAEALMKNVVLWVAENGTK